MVKSNTAFKGSKEKYRRVHYMLVQELGSDDWLQELSVHMCHNMLKNLLVVLNAFRGALQIPG
jgi:hypothetical protein